MWVWFLKLSGQRQFDETSQPISWADQKGFFDLYDLRPSPWELDAIVQLDGAFLSSLSRKTDGTVGSAKSLSARVTNRKGKE